MDYGRIYERRDMSSTRKREWLIVMEMVISRIYNIFLEVELDKLSDRLVVRIERWKNER